MSTVIDLTMDDSDGEMQESDTKGKARTSVTSEREIPDSVMADDIDHDELQASIERNVLQPNLPLPNWGTGGFNYDFGFRISKPLTKPKSSSADPSPRSSLESESLSIQQSTQTSVGSESFSEIAAGKQPASKRPSDFTPASSEADLQILDSEPQSFLQPPSKRLRLDTDLTMPAPNAGFIGHPDAPLASPKLEPDSVREIVELEEDEAAEAAEEVEHEEATEFMHEAAVDEQGSKFMDIIDLSLDDEVLTRSKSTRPQSRVPPGPDRRQSSIKNISTAFSNLHLDLVPFATHGDHIYKPGDDVQFHNGTFMRIKHLRRRPDRKVILSGPLLTRHYHHSLDTKNWQETRLFPEKGRGNEVIWTVTIDGWQKEDQDYVDRELSEVLRPREIHFTNQTWPCTSSQTWNGRRGKELFRTGPLYCRWKRVKQVHIKKADKEQEYEDCVVRLTQKEADPEYDRQASQLRFAWRHQHIPPGGGSESTRRDIVGVDGKTKQETFYRYSFADCFCGCGGASKGAELAECAIKWAIDFDEKAADSYIANFPTATCHREDIFDFLRRIRESPAAASASMVDILHMSPPCQAFSLARTTGTVRAKEIIEAALTSTGEILNYVKPRIATMEETAGLLYAHKDWLAMAIREMIDKGYSVRWKIMKSEQYRVAQLRKRLVIIASGPGETLPPWPKPTHGDKIPGLKPLASIDTAIRDIPPQAKHHRVISQFKDGQPRAGFDGKKTQAKTLTCGGGIGNYHPDGLRPYTIRELACLQTFPVLYSFANAGLTVAKRQIGNAFPPTLARAVYREIVKVLKEADNEEL